jgi:hypothetical protein
VRIERPAQDAAQIADRGDERGAPGDRSGEQIVVAAEVLGGGVDDQIDAEGERALVDRRGEGRVDDRLDAMAPADVGDALEVEGVVWRIASWRRS